ncbi:hypothetical protein CANCADRAFT_106605 [Tortispora caseinolytica NRRL Y-17796]|uniref:Multifunctional tryptophan biosynthesis protein n=1 Tax=Tortispora caseinolytica NRRL Y-17796 TaxID=767744 RepID=A0A1E4TFJ6_9ASCO|nr:hypothetical protein CANCADRAFT_106605 [Tortispora caseinolytica NRRL Y-17796]
MRHSPPNVVLIDNYDSFTWNVYQYLVHEGADVTVFRNDKVTVAEIEALEPTHLVISPGPGHPLTDSGVSLDALRAFAGKIPIFGVCLGEQCIFLHFGGDVKFAGEIVHGKTSPIIHDGKHIFAGIPQRIAATRYHSLAATGDTVPDVLEVTARTESGVIMGIRHKELTIEGVQFHPESILTEEGHMMFRNFLNLSAGTWAACSSSIPVLPTGSESILDKIFLRTRQDVEARQQLPGHRLQDYQNMLDFGLAAPVIDFYTRLQSKLPSASVSLLAEIKRASPSKGPIDPNANSALQARTYALAGASAISILTEPHWFKGSLEDMRAARAAVSAIPDRPAILRKDFILSRYQILEARAYGADSVLLIVKMLSLAELQDLYAYAKSLQMEPLVEVSSAEEMQVALQIGSKVIGVNNRDLHSFKVDMNTTSALSSMVPDGVILCALSGISDRESVARYEADGVKGILVGESLMRSSSVNTFIAELLGVDALQKPKQSVPLVKICGVRTAKDAKLAVEAGADLIGVIMVPNSKRTVSINDAADIVNVVKSFKQEKEFISCSQYPKDWFSFNIDEIRRKASSRPLVVGVFRNQSLSEVCEIIEKCGFDMIQFHGSEPVDYARFCSVPAIHRFTPGDSQSTIPGYHNVILYDSEAGGTGTKTDITCIPLDTPFALAGGLTPENVKDYLHLNPAIVDVSSGVEGADGYKDPTKLQQFVANVRTI